MSQTMKPGQQVRHRNTGESGTYVRTNDHGHLVVDFGLGEEAMPLAYLEPIVDIEYRTEDAYGTPLHIDTDDAGRGITISMSNQDPMILTPEATVEVCRQLLARALAAGYLGGDASLVQL